MSETALCLDLTIPIPTKNWSNLLLLYFFETMLELNILNYLFVSRYYEIC